MEFTVECQLPQKTRRPVMRIAIETLQGQGQRIFTLHSDFKRDATQPWNVSAGKCTFRCKVPNLALMPGEYSANLVLELAGTDLARLFGCHICNQARLTVCTLTLMSSAKWGERVEYIVSLITSGRPGKPLGVSIRIGKACLRGCQASESEY